MLHDPFAVQKLVNRAVDARRIERGVRSRLKTRYGFNDAQVSALFLAADPVKASTQTQYVLAAAALERGKLVREPAIPLGPRRSRYLKGAIF
jgi:hypothetical protein